MFRAGISVSPQVKVAVVFDLPGCSCTGATVDEVLSLLPVTIAEYARWLARHGEPVDASDVSVSIAEEVDPERAEGVEGEFVYQDDLRPLEPEDVERAVRWMGYAREDLLSATDGLASEILYWPPPASAMARIDPWKPAPLTIREILRDVAAAEHYYSTALCDGPSPEDSADELTDLGLQRDRAIHVLRTLGPADSGRVFSPRRPWQTDAERWTARKVVRRIISHERFHTAEIQQRLCWVLLGVPHVRASVP